MNETARQRWVLFGAKCNILHAIPHLPYKHMINGGRSSPALPEPDRKSNQYSCSQCAGLGDEMKQYMESVICVIYDIKRVST